MIDLRRFRGVLSAATVIAALTPSLLSAQQLNGKLIQRAIPSTGEMIPVIGLAFSNHPSCADKTALKEVVKTFADNGGRYFDATLGNVASEQFHIDAAKEVGVANKFFWSFRSFLPGGPGAPPQASDVKTQFDAVLGKLNAPKIDIAWVNVTSDPALLNALKEEKKAGRVKYIGAMTIVTRNQAAQLEAIMRNEPIDFIGVEYDIGNRFVEEKILPLAIEKKIGVVAFFPFSNNSGVSCGTLSRNLFARVGNRPLPSWASEFDATSWSQFFTKYVISHPAITVARIGTTKPSHMIDNMAGGVGRLPNEAMRKRMAEFIDSLPPIPPPVNPAAAPGIPLPATVLDRYVGEYATEDGGFVATFRRDRDRLAVKPGNNPEAPLNARSETRFQDPRGPIFEFKLDAQGNVTGAILEQPGPQGTQKIPLKRK